MKVFWSWQSDTPGNTGRHFVRAALDDAVKLLKLESDVSEPHELARVDKLHVDQDRQNIPGSPDLAQLILEKIEASSVFIADITPVSIVPSNQESQSSGPKRRNMNPNVAIELGYAIRTLGDRRFISILNTHYGSRDDIPFDIAHKAGPITYDLAPSATKEEVKSARKILAVSIKNALKLYVTGGDLGDPGNSLYLHLFPDPQSQERKRYKTCWGNSDNVPSVRLKYFDTYPDGGPPEKCLTFHITNMGKQSVRKVHIDWRFDASNIDRKIILSKIVDGCITNITDGALSYIMKSAHGTLQGRIEWSYSGYSEIPIISVGSSAQIELPIKINEAVSLWAIAESCMQHWQSNFLNRLTKQHVPPTYSDIPNIFIEVAYETDDSRIFRQSFSVAGIVTGTGSPSDKDGTSYMIYPPQGSAALIEIKQFPSAQFRTGDY